MNNLLFLNHLLLFELDHSLKNNKTYEEYLSIYRFFPNPPGIEYFNPRNINIDLHGPWQLEPTIYPLPALPASPITFEQAADEFGSNIAQELDRGQQVYIMWSGGIDSTAVAVSVLKYLKPTAADNLHVVLSEFSKHENPMFYHKFLSALDQIDVREFDPAKLNLHNSIILDGEGGDQIFGSSAANDVFSRYPDHTTKPWKTNIDFLRNYWYKDSVPHFWDWLVNLMNQTIDQGSAPVETLFDFFWWLNFNCKLDSILFRHTLRLSENIPNEQFEYFANHVMRRFYASDKMQQWSMTAGADAKINQAKKTVKWAGRKYIYDFDNNEYYFREKRKEFSSEVLSKLNTKYFAVDRNYCRYSFRDRKVRQQIGNKFQIEKNNKT